VEEVERNIKIFDGILRHLTSRVEVELKRKAAAPSEAVESPATAEGQPPAGSAPPAAPAS
jgi:hypothetical protein